MPRKEKYPYDMLLETKMNAVTEIICTGCDQVIGGECVVKQIDGKEEHYHPNCARARKIKLPVQIRFI